MRILRGAGMVVALVASLWGALPVMADGGSASVDLTVGWGAGAASGGGTAAQPSWIPFTALINIPAGHGDWTGTLIIAPKAATNGGFCAGNCGTGVTYQETVTVHPGTPRTFVIFGQYQADSPPTYEARITDSNGVTIARSSSASLRPNYVTIGVLSDAPAAESFFRGVAMGQTAQAPQVRDHHFDKVENLPSTALQLTGFHALVIDDFDSSTLSQAQARAIQDYVGFGGSLVITGGANWRRTLGQLPAALIPLRPDSTASAALGAVADLSGGTFDLSAPVATGVLAPGARVVLADAAGIPLLAEVSYGAGRVVEITFDPALDPVFGTAVAGQAWTQALNRSISPSRITGGYAGGPVPVPLVVPAPGATPGATTGSGGGSSAPVPPAGGFAGAGQLTPVPTARFGPGLESQVFNVLGNSPASALPPLGLLGALLVGYVILAGPANYLWLRRRRRELTWVTVPLIAILFTGIAYGAGSAYKGSDFIANEIQLLRVAPGGTVDATMLDALFNSRRGDFVVDAPDGSLAVSIGQFGVLPGARADHVNPGRHPSIALNDVPVWSERNVKVEATLRTGTNLEAHLSIAGLHVRGSITNRGTRVVRDLALLTVSGEWASLAPSLAPGATVKVDSPLGKIPDYAGNLNTGCTAKGCPPQVCDSSRGALCQPTCAPVSVIQSCRTGGAPTDSAALGEPARSVLAEVAAGASVMGRTDVQALVATVDPLPGVTIHDRSPNRHSIAALAVPVVLDSMDSLPSGWAGARLVTSLSTSQGANSLNVWDFELPARVEGGLRLQYGTPGVPVPTKPGSGPVPITQTTVELYDWSSGSWSRLAYDVRCAGAPTTFCAPISAHQLASGLVRVRTRNSPFYNFQMQLLSAASA